MAAPVPVALIPLYATFRIVILNLKTMTDVESSLKKLVLLNFNIKMANDFALKKILKYTPVSEELKDLKDMVIAKVEKLENRIAEAKDMVEEAPMDQDGGSSSDDSEPDDEDSDEEVSGDEDSDSSSDDEEPPAKKPCLTSGPVKPTAQKTFCEVLPPSKTAPKLPKLTIKLPNPFARRSPQPLVPAARNPRNLSSDTSHPLEPVAQRLIIKVPNPFAKKSTTQPLENAKVATLDPCMKRPRPTEAPIRKYTIPRKPLFSQPANSATPLEEDFFSRKRTAPAKIVPKPKVKVTTDHPVPLLSIVLERPGWLREEILNRY